MRINVKNSAKYLKNKRYSEGALIPDNASCLTVITTREAWPKTTKDRIGYLTIDLSLDGGKTWINHWLGCSLNGGDYFSKDRITGVQIKISETTVTRPLPNGTNRRASINMDIAETLNTIISIEVV